MIIMAGPGSASSRLACCRGSALSASGAGQSKSVAASHESRLGVAASHDAAELDLGVVQTFESLETAV